MEKPVMTFKVVRYDAKTIEIQKVSTEFFRKEDVVIVKIPKLVSPKEVQSFVSQIKIAFPNESLVIVGHEIEFARLVDIDKPGESLA